MNIMGTTNHLRMAKSVLTDLRNRGYEENASLLFAGADRAAWLDNNCDNKTMSARRDSQAGMVDLSITGSVASIGPVYQTIRQIASASGGSLMDVCKDMGLPSETSGVIQQWLDDGKYILLLNNVSEDQAEFLKYQLGDLQGLDDLTFC